MHIGDPVHVALHEGDRIKSGIGAVARINAQFQPVGVNFGQHTFDIRSISGSKSMNPAACG